MTTQQVDPMRACKEAKQRLQEAAQTLNSTGEIFVRLGQALQAEPVGVTLANTDLGQPIDLPDDYVIAYADIPTPEGIKDGLGNYYRAWSEYQAAFQKLPPDEQALFAGPGTERPARRTMAVRQLRV